MEEIWKDIEGYEGLYQVSTWGRVRSLNYNHTGKTQILRPGVTHWGYLQVAIYKDGEQKSYKVHRLVAAAFLPNPNGLPEINHKDEDKQNNHVDNLELCDRAYNNSYGTHNARMIRSQLNSPTKSKRVRCIETNTVYPSGGEAERKTGISRKSISSACHGKYKTAGGFHWEFVTNSAREQSALEAPGEEDDG